MYYMLEDIDIFGSATLHGPIIIVTAWLQVPQ